MFDHLDDPRPPAFDDRFRRSVLARARRRQRRRRAAVGAGVAMWVAVLGVGGLYGRAAWRATGIDRVDVAGTNAVASGDPVTFLVVGTDAATGGGWYAEAVLLARIDPRAGTAALLSLPRDLMVPAGGGGGEVELGSAGTDDPGGLVAVVESYVGVPVDHLVTVDFDGVIALVDRLGGIAVRVDRPVRDTSSGALLEAGCTTLDGEQALALLRSRRLEVMDDHGNWVRDTVSDLRRIEVQREVVIAALAGLADEGLDPVSVDRHVDWALDHVAVDRALGADELVALARAAAAIDPADVSSATIPWIVHPGNPNRVALDPARLEATAEAFTSGRTLPPGDPGDGVSGAPPGTASPFEAPIVGPC